MCAVRVNDAKISTENAFDQDKQGTESNHKCNKEEKAVLGSSGDMEAFSKTAKYIHLCFLNIISLLMFLCFSPS